MTEVTRVIEKTLVHLIDDKRWEAIREIEGDWNTERYFVPKHKRSECYEFHKTGQSFEEDVNRGGKVTKHLYFEMKQRYRRKGRILNEGLEHT